METERKVTGNSDNERDSQYKELEHGNELDNVFCCFKGVIAGRSHQDPSERG